MEPHFGTLPSTNLTITPVSALSLMVLISFSGHRYFFALLWQAVTRLDGPGFSSQYRCLNVYFHYHVQHNQWGYGVTFRGSRGERGHVRREWTVKHHVNARNAERSNLVISAKR